MGRKPVDLRIKVGDVITAHQVDQIRRLEAENGDLAREVTRWREAAHEATVALDRVRAAIEGAKYHAEYLPVDERGELEPLVDAVAYVVEQRDILLDDLEPAELGGRIGDERLCGCGDGLVSIDGTSNEELPGVCPSCAMCPDKVERALKRAVERLANAFGLTTVWDLFDLSSAWPTASADFVACHATYANEAYTDGYRDDGYIARCHDCDWTGSRVYADKDDARDEAAAHARATRARSNR